MSATPYRIDELLVLEATDGLSAEQRMELDRLLDAHPEVDRHSFESAVGAVFMTSAGAVSEMLPSGLYAGLLQAGQRILSESD